MTDVVDVVEMSELSGWAGLVGVGAIVAAFISGVHALVYGTVHAWALKRVAVDTARRTSKVALCAPVLEHVRVAAAFAAEIRSGTIRSREAFAAQTAQWVDRMRAAPEVMAFPDRTLARAWAFAREQDLKLIEALRRGTSGDERTTSILGAAGAVLTGWEAVELAVEGYVFELPGKSRAAQRTMRRFVRARVMKDWVGQLRVMTENVFTR